MHENNTKLHSYLAHSFSGRPHIPASPCQSGLVCLNATRYEPLVRAIDIEIGFGAIGVLTSADDMQRDIGTEMRQHGVFQPPLPIEKAKYYSH